tara:strand:+ start:523 stop:1707 length:1185 start_codon:yes stop_codon:yes gene_type:complete
MTVIANLFAAKPDGTYYTSGAYHTQGVYTVEHNSSNSTVYIWQLGNAAWGGLLADHTFSYNTATKIWSDVGSSNPVQVCNGSTFANTTSSSANQQTVSFWQGSTSKLFELDNPYYTTGPTVTQTRITHTGIIPNASGFTVRNPNPGPFYSKTGAHRFQIKYYDQNEPSYNLTVTWTTASGTVSDSQTVTPASGDVQFTYNFSANAASDQPITGPITVSFNATLTHNNISYNAGDTVKTFQYYETGPYTASFSPNFGLPGQTITVSMIDDNPYPDYDTYMNYVSPNNSITNVLNGANNYRAIISPFHEGEGVYTGDTAGSYNIYGPFDSAANVNTSSSKLLANANYDANYIAPSTTSNGGGKPDRYPIIMTNLFNRNRSIYSIGMTHKDTWNLFL